MRWLIITTLGVVLNSIAFGQSNQDCFDCHDDNEMTMEKRGKEISLYVSPVDYQKSAHADLECIDCHEDFDPWEEPHKENITAVNCAECHDDAAHAFKTSGHANELNCNSCHGDVHKPQTKAQMTNCESCHKQEKLQLAVSVHAENEMGPGCSDCHSSHEATTVSSAECLSCHGEKEFVHENIAHEDFDAMMHYSESIHGEVIECNDCHNGHNIFAVTSEQSPVNKKNIVNLCTTCHDDIKDEFLASEHGRALKTDFDHAPTCTNCHGEHDIHQISDSRSKMSRVHEEEVCMSCHLDDPEIKATMTHGEKFISGYDNSVHGRKFKEGNLDAAICSDCHGAHSAMKASDPNSMVNKFNIAQTCAKCHMDISLSHATSIHGQALEEGVMDAPTCTDCHGEHNILEAEQKNSPVASTNLSDQVCGPCHSSVKLSEKYDLESTKFDAYQDSYHGLAVSFGDVQAANCASCHGVHNILPSSDPKSMIHKENLATTCGSCHPGANENFAKGTVHIVATEDEDTLIYWISTIYIALIVGTIGSMGVHNIADFVRKLIHKYKEDEDPTPEFNVYEKKKTKYVRMTLEDRIQHIGLAGSFILLTITGFMLKFPDAWWVEGIRSLGGEQVFQLRGLLHRISAVIMVLVSLYHIYYAVFTERGRQFIKDIMLNFQDFRDMVAMMRYNFGMSKKYPVFDRFNYIEKAEYWALIWGTIVMTVTGFVLWFENQSMAWFSKLFLDVNETIHYYEAWLAMLAIVVWHFYYVIFNPDIYPMNFTWLTGKVSEEEMEKEHPLHLEKLKNKTESQDENDETDNSNEEKEEKLIGDKANEGK